MATLSLPHLPAELLALRALALDLRWTWSHEGDALWNAVDAQLWEQTHNPWVMLQTVAVDRLEALVVDQKFRGELSAFAEAREQYLRAPGWFRGTAAANQLGGVAFFSMEFGLGEALPLYAGGLGVLAGDYLKAASDLDIPVTGIGLLYQEGYFRQMVGASGVQQEFFPYNEPAAMPIEPVLMPDGDWLSIGIDLPGRQLRLRVWQATVGRVRLYLLDSNHQLNTAPDRGITAKLYGEGTETRLLQEIALGVGGWRVMAALRPEIEICHINEGHAAFAIVERVRQLMLRTDLDFDEALWATRAGNIFTTHTPVAAGFDRFPPELVHKHLLAIDTASQRARIDIDKVLALGRADRHDEHELFNVAFLARRGAAVCVGVSRLHGEVSRQIFQPLYPRWPPAQVPVGHVTNGVHIPSWDSAGADRVWTDSSGKERWRSAPGQALGIAEVSDEDLWAMRAAGRRHLVEVARRRLGMQLQQRGVDPEEVRSADFVLDPNVLTLGLARRFTEYKRPNLLLHDMERLQTLLLDDLHPIQIIVAGKAHPADLPGKAMIRDWIELARQPRFRRRVVFLEDYDIALAQDLVQGVDLWVNTPRRPWEACGTSGMKVLVNGGLNCSVLDGWWDEAFEPDVGWAIGGPVAGTLEEGDRRDAAELLQRLETEIAPEFYDRDAEGLPRAWLQRVRNSMARLTPAFSSARMLQNYVETAYVPLSEAVRRRIADGGAVARALAAWADGLASHWAGLHIGEPTCSDTAAGRTLAVSVLLGDIPPIAVRVEAFADSGPGCLAEGVTLEQDHAIPGATNGYIYAGSISAARATSDYTVRVVAWHADARLPAELPLIAWQR